VDRSLLAPVPVDARPAAPRNGDLADSRRGLADAARKKNEELLRLGRQIDACGGG
jgi:hypothetical protein